MKLSDFLKKENIFFVQAQNKQKLFELIADTINKDTKEIKSKDILLELMNNREQQTNTYAIKSVAIPHIKCENLENFKIYIFILKDGIDYKEGEEKVKIVFMIIGPDKKYNIHLILLSRIARLIKETPIIKDILNEQKESKIKTLIEKYEERII